MVEIEAKLERDTCIIGKTLGIVSIGNSFRSLTVNRYGVVVEEGCEISRGSI